MPQGVLLRRVCHVNDGHIRQGAEFPRINIASRYSVCVLCVCILYVYTTVHIVVEDKGLVVCIGGSGAHSCMWHIRFFLFVGKRVVVRPQCKSAEYYFHHRPSFAEESSIIFVTTFLSNKKMHFARVIEIVFKSSIFVIPY